MSDAQVQGGDEVRARRLRALLPLAIFVGVLAFLGVGLKGNPRELPSALIDKPAPSFRLTTLATPLAPERTFGSADLRGQVWVLNVWASWCTACRLEHPLLVEFARSNTVPIYGLNYKDAPPDAQRWLANFGDPYQHSFSDRDGRVGMDFGVYGAPETFVIDAAGRVRFKHVGPLTPEVLQEQIVPLVRRLRA
jgi:cytochrome c biogenesis protein CcmG/thiol:disulfide interchange protein DsbE